MNIPPLHRASLRPLLQLTGAFGALGFGFGFLWAWLATGPRLLLQINWDNGGYLSGCVTGKLTPSSEPWSAHLAIGHVYLAFVSLARALGATPVQGFRLATALAFGAATALLCAVLHRLTRDRLLAALLTLCWMTAWVNQFLLYTLEDNLLYLPPAVALLGQALLRPPAWTYKDSLVAGALGAAGALVSWQALLYLGPPLYAALLAGTAAGTVDRPRSLAVRLRDAALVLAAFLAALLLWVAVVSAATDLTAPRLLRIVFSPPGPGGKLHIGSPTEIARNLLNIGTGALFQLSHRGYLLAGWAYDRARELPRLPFSLSTLGAVVLALEFAGLCAATYLAFARRPHRAGAGAGAGAGLHVLAVALLLFTLAAGFYRDHEWRYLIRFDFLPLLGVLLVGGILGASGPVPAPLRHAAAVGLCLVALAQLAGGLRQDRAQLRQYPPFSAWREGKVKSGMCCGRDGQSWYGYFHGIRQRHPRACAYVFAPLEVRDGTWDYDMIGTLWSELPEHVVVGDPAAYRAHRYPPRVLSPAQVLAQGLSGPCAYVSPEARALLSSVSGGAP